jgi:hypothetical protein
MILNAALRFFWLWTIYEYEFDFNPESVLNQIQILVTTKIFAEALRRSVWAIIRVENENIKVLSGIKSSLRSLSNAQAQACI